MSSKTAVCQPMQMTQIFNTHKESAKIEKNHGDGDLCVFTTKLRLVLGLSHDDCLILCCVSSQTIFFVTCVYKTSNKIYVLYCKVSRNFNEEGKAGKFTVSFAFCAHVDVMKYRKIRSFLRAHADYLIIPEVA